MKTMSLREVFNAYREGSFPGTIGLSETARVSEFVAFLAKGLKTALMNQYGVFIGPVNWLFKNVTSDMYTETWPKLSAPDLPAERLATGDFIRIGFNSESVNLTNKEYGAIMEIDRYLIDTDQTKMIMAIPGKMGEAMGRQEHNISYTFFNNGLTNTCYDAAFVFALVGAAHPNVTGGAANAQNTNGLALGALTEANYETAIQTMQAWRGIFGELLSVNPTGIITGTTDQFTAQRLFKDPYRQGTATNIGGVNKNIFYNTIDVQMDKAMTAASWYVKTNIDGFIKQILTPLEVAQEAENSGLSFDTRVFRYRVYQAGVLGCVDWRNFIKGN